MLLEHGLPLSEETCFWLFHIASTFAQEIKTNNNESISNMLVVNFFKFKSLLGHISSGVLIEMRERWQSLKRYYLTFKFWDFKTSFSRSNDIKEMRVVQFYA